jgi:O-acetyl-ADP-ribose deacetylase (regulator of RNase III)
MSDADSVSRKIGTCTVLLTCGDITRQDTDAIVNAANSLLLGGGGVDGAIHRAGGPVILETCQLIVARIGRLPAGRAVITTGGNLPAKYVIHAVGPVWYGGDQNEAATLADAYRNSLEQAVDVGVRTLAFPSISTGAYRFPIEQAAVIALSTVIEFVKQTPLNEVRFVLFSQYDFNSYANALERLMPEPS